MHNVELVHVTPDAESLIAYMARVSNPANQDNDNYTGLIKYLIKHKHWSPFEMVNMCVQIDTTRSVASQILRHRSFSFQEFSQRYAQVVNTPQLPNLRRQDTKNRQNSIDDLDPFLTQQFEMRTQELYKQSLDLYTDMLDHGVAKECATTSKKKEIKSARRKQKCTLYLHRNHREVPTEVREGHLVDHNHHRRRHPLVLERNQEAV